MNTNRGLLALYLGLVTGYAVGVPGSDAVTHGAWRFGHDIRLDHGEIGAAFMDALSDHVKVHQPRGLVLSAPDDDAAAAVVTVGMIMLARVYAYRRSLPIAVVSPSDIKLTGRDVAAWQPKSRAATDALRLWRHARLVARAGAGDQ